MNGKKKLKEKINQDVGNTKTSIYNSYSKRSCSKTAYNIPPKTMMNNFKKKKRSQNQI